MKANLLHNPKAGDKDHSEAELVDLIRSHGIDCIYSSSKKDWWDDLDPASDFVIIAGGDGTVRKVILRFLQGKAGKKQYPLALLPMGTANNISRSVNSSGQLEHIIASWHKERIRKFDVGQINGFKEHVYFLEGIGFGVFPVLMDSMKEKEKKARKEPPPEEKLRSDLEQLYDIVTTYPVAACQLEIDGRDYSGKYILLEIMNIRSVGPGLNINKDADVGDGKLEVIMIGEDKRKSFAAYIKDCITSDVQKDFDLPVIKGQQIKVIWDDIHGHIDDELIKVDRQKGYMINVLKRELQFLVPD
ncbi:diacylglycerol/lipid kinase family protein [Chitinophaga tropicalis]|uniref:Diacylglycerol kinase n=1 Tax=Chitinophaga tropicalis TaxID=2683588 RepID=A0A7K1U6J0_9BACT|nr:diacylglycerol kinase family protein [Chitinophaga tropicalis]MVT09978.1 diacylglycerol kinase [Chitinophaga tropicalis]